MIYKVLHKIELEWRRFYTTNFEIIRRIKHSEERENIILLDL